MTENHLERARSLHDKIRQVLMQDWDPIGVNGIPEAADEYDMYIPELYILLIKRRPVHEVFDFLTWVVSEKMGLSENKRHTLLIAEKLILAAQE